MATLQHEYNTLSKRGILKIEIPKYIEENLNPIFKLREYQKEAITRFIYYLEHDTMRIKPSQLLFHMATGSGKTLLMAANIVWLYNKGYRNFLFFVNSTNIIEKTRDNFLNLKSSKYLLNDKLKFDDKEINIIEVDNFEASNKDDINMIFTTIQGLHSNMNAPKENIITYEDFKDKKIVIISDEAHHINAWTKNRLNKTDALEKNTWEHTVNNIFHSNPDNIMLEYTATVGLENKAVFDKYQNKVLYEYTLKEFRLDGYSKEVKVLQADLDNIDRMLQAMILSQYRRKIAEKNKIHLKPVILFKSKTIKESKQNEVQFHEKIKTFSVKDINRIKSQAEDSILEKAFDYFKTQNISLKNLITELKEDFSEEKCMLLDSKNIDEEKQLMLNSLEDENNEVRAIFAVDMLNEGWDVLNLFDIVRLYDTRDSRSNRPGKTTIREAQLIGRGARYYPFKLKEEDEKFKRKYDQELNSDIKIIEELYYHSSHNPRYIQELKIALIESGIMPPKEPKIIELKVKEGIKRTEFWKKGFIFINKMVKSDRTKIKDINDIDVTKIYGPFRLRTGFTYDRTIFDEFLSLEKTEEIVTKQFELKGFNIHIIRKALSKLDFYKFDNLNKYFPGLDSITEFIDSLKQVKVDLRSSSERLNNLSVDDKLNICINILTQLQSQIKSGYTEYEGTKLFVQNNIKNIVKDKMLQFNIGDNSDQEFGIAMSETNKDNLRLNLSNKEWYIYNENYGTDEEKNFIQFINGVMEKLEENHSEIYLVRNAKLFQIYRFSDGKPTEPDFVLFMKKRDTKNIVQYQLFIEPKGPHLVQTDQWKEDFLKEIENNYELEILAQNTKYRLLGMPFYTENNKSDFIDYFNEKIGVQ